MGVVLAWVSLRSKRVPAGEAAALTYISTHRLG